MSAYRHRVEQQPTAIPAGEGAQWAHQPALDGLRAIAVYLVVLFHAGLQLFSGGFVGVDVFFVLSGFLVTNVLLAEWSRNSSIDLGRFYARRVRRLLPAAIFTVAVTAVLATFVLSRLARQDMVGDAQASLLYVANWNFLSDATNYFSDDVDQSPFLHFWSLAIEEQFYIAYPLVVIGLLKLGRRLPLALPVGLSILLVASLIAQAVYAATDPLRAYYGTDARVYQMLAGAVLATLFRTLRTSSRGARLQNLRWPSVVPFAATTGLLIVASNLVMTSASWSGVMATVLSVLLIGSLHRTPTSRVARLISLRPVAYLGRISYGTYLFHWPVIVLLQPIYEPSPILLATVAAIVSTVLSAISFRFLETPIRRRASFDAWPKRIVVAGLATSLASAALVVPFVLDSDRRPVSAAREVASVDVSGSATEAASQAVPADLNLEATEPLLVDVADCGVSDPDSCVLVDGDGPHIHLIGDSNAEMLTHAMLLLATENDWTLSLNTQLGCPWQPGLVWIVDDDRRVEKCIERRNEWYDTIIPSLEPDLIVAIGVPRDDVARGDGSSWLPEPAYSSLDLDQAIQAATTAAADTLTEGGTRLLIVEPLPYSTEFNPTDCLTTAQVVGDCAYNIPPDPLPSEVAYRTVAASSDRVDTLDLDTIACPFRPTCLAFIDGRTVFRNQLHLSDAWLVAQRDELLKLIELSGSLSS